MNDARFEKDGGFGNLAQPFFSIVTVCFNAENIIEETVKSLTAQTCGDKEYIVIDGLSLDDTVGVLSRYRSEINVLKSEPDSGIYDAMNKAMDIATGQYVYFLNAGDYFLDNGVLSDVKRRITEIGYPSLVVGNLVTKLHAVKYTPDRLSRGLIRRTLPHQALFIATSQHGKFNVAYRIAADFDRLLDLASNELKMVHIDRNIAYYDVLKSDKTEFERGLYDIRRSREKVQICMRRLSGFTCVLSTALYIFQWFRIGLKQAFLKDSRKVDTS